MNLKKILAASAISLSMVAGVGAAIGVSAGSEMRLDETFAATDTTVFCAIDATTLGSYTMKCNINRKGDGNDWYSYDMYDTGKLYDSKKIFAASFTDLYDGVGAMQFQLWSDVWKAQVDPISGWTESSVYLNKLWVYGGSGWIANSITGAQFYSEAGVAGDTLTYNDETGQYEGLISLAANEKFYIKKTYSIGVELNLYTIQDGVTAVEEDGTYVKAKTSTTYIVYLKGNNVMWVDEAGASLIAYAYAGYFNTNVGCDADGILEPSGWATVKARYENAQYMSDGAKDFIKENLEDAGQIGHMLARYRWAINNHAGLDNFLKDSSGNEIISRAGAGARNVTAPNNGTGNFALIASIAAGTVITAVGATFLLRRRKEDR